MISSFRRMMAQLRGRGRETAASVNATAAAPLSEDYRRLFQDAMAAFRAGDYRQSASGFERCIELRSDDADAHLNLGFAWHRLGKLEDAADSYTLALYHRGDFAEAHFNLGVVDMGRGEYERAARAFETAVRLKPDYVESLNNLGYVQFSYLDQVAEGEVNL